MIYSRIYAKIDNELLFDEIEFIDEPIPTMSISKFIGTKVINGWSINYNGKTYKDGDVIT